MPAAIADVIERLRVATAADPAAGRVAVAVSGALTGRTASELRCRGHRVTADEPEAFGGEDAAPGPLDYALVALASSQALTYRFWAEQLGIAIDGVEVRAEGDADLRGFLGLETGVRPGFSAIRVDVAVTGPEPAARYRELADAVDAHCPVLDLFSRATPVERRLSSR